MCASRLSPETSDHQRCTASSLLHYDIELPTLRQWQMGSKLIAIAVPVLSPAASIGPSKSSGQARPTLTNSKSQRSPVITTLFQLD